MRFVCETCKQDISESDFSDSLAVIEKDRDGKYVRGCTVHKGYCDDKFSKIALERGNFANASVELSTFVNKEQIPEYLDTGDVSKVDYDDDLFRIERDKKNKKKKK